MAKAIVVVGVGPTNIQVLRDAASTEEDWQAFDRLTSRQGRKMAAAARREGEAWCVTVAAEHVTEEDLDADDAAGIESGRAKRSRMLSPLPTAFNKRRRSPSGSRTNA
jgi:uncharacterized protein YcaQ